ncbi:hypothetical protein ACF2G4_14530 [Pantoea sp. C3]|uniref:hypothetical protein n=1 Tax=Pantoea phytostimulans TaxID=2769024 RepID=UPI0038F7A1B9
MILLTIGSKSHELSAADAKQLALAIACEVDKPGQPQRFNGKETNFSVQSATSSTENIDTQTFSRKSIALTNC